MKVKEFLKPFPENDFVVVETTDGGLVWEGTIDYVPSDIDEMEIGFAYCSSNGELTVAVDLGEEE
jgi:hypothetical protein